MVKPFELLGSVVVPPGNVIEYAEATAAVFGTTAWTVMSMFFASDPPAMEAMHCVCAQSIGSPFVDAAEADVATVTSAAPPTATIARSETKSRR